MKVFVIDVNECSGCYQCQIACKDEHCGNDWTPYTKPQPEWGHFWGTRGAAECASGWWDRSERHSHTRSIGTLSF